MKKRTLLGISTNPGQLNNKLFWQAVKYLENQGYEVWLLIGDINNKTAINISELLQNDEEITKNANELKILFSEAVQIWLKKKDDSITKKALELGDFWETQHSNFPKEKIFRVGKEFTSNKLYQKIYNYINSDEFQKTNHGIAFEKALEKSALEYMGRKTKNNNEKLFWDESMDGMRKEVALFLALLYEHKMDTFFYPNLGTIKTALQELNKALKEKCDKALDKEFDQVFKIEFEKALKKYDENTFVDEMDKAWSIVFGNINLEKLKTLKQEFDKANEEDKINFINKIDKKEWSAIFEPSKPENLQIFKHPVTFENLKIEKLKNLIDQEEKLEQSKKELISAKITIFTQENTEKKDSKPQNFISIKGFNDNLKKHKPNFIKQVTNTSIDELKELDEVEKNINDYLEIIELKKENNNEYSFLFDKKENEGKKQKRLSDDSIKQDVESTLVY